MIAGERDPARLAGLALGVLRRKTEELAMACDGRFTAGHGHMCRLHLDAYDHLTAKIAEPGRPGRRGSRAVRGPHRPADHYPGIGQRTAEVIIAETGRDMARFATAARLAARAGLAKRELHAAQVR